MRVISYSRVSTQEQADSGLGLAAQQEAIQHYCSAQGWVVGKVIVDGGASGKNLEREGIQEALTLLAEGQYDGLVVAKLDRATRSVVDAANLIERAKTQGWKLVALDFGLDPTTPTGELVASILAAVAQWERRMIGQRISEALQAAKAEGRQLGRKSRIAHEIVSYIVTVREVIAASYSSIAKDLNNMGKAAPEGGEWTRSQVRRVYKTATAPQAED